MIPATDHEVARSDGKEWIFKPHHEIATATDSRLQVLLYSHLSDQGLAYCAP